MASTKPKIKKKRKTNSTHSLGHDEGVVKEFLNQITRAAYVVALKTGFRGSFIKFLTELQDALEGVIRQDQKKRAVSH